MNKLIVGFLCLAALFSFIDAVAEGGGGNVATQLDGQQTAAAVTMQVDSTTYFLDTGVLFVDNEKEEYTSKDATHFYGLTRSFEGTTAALHTDNTIVYNESMGVMNAAMGFNIGQVTSMSGVFSVVTIPFNLLTKTLPRIATWDYGFLSGDLIYIRYFLMLVTIGCFVYLALAMIWAAMGILKK